MNSVVKYYRHLDKVPQLSSEEISALAPVEKQFAFRTNSYYLGLIDWNDPADPLRRLVIPSLDELHNDGEFDASGESDYTVARGLQHKYEDTALMLVAETCDSYCRYCFRKRITMRHSDEAGVNTDEAIEYVSQHPAIRNVLLTGGDPLIISTVKLQRILSQLSAIKHLRAIRIGTKVTSFHPQRILEDEQLLKLLGEHSRHNPKIYLMNHFSHPRELTAVARETILSLKDHGVEMMNQCPLIRGVNDNPSTLHDLYSELMSLGVHPYYLFICRPTRGNSMFTVPIVEAWQTFQESLSGLPGLARTARLAISHHSGKLEITGLDRDHIYLRYHRAADEGDHGRHLVCYRDDHATWFDQLREVSHTPYREHGRASRVGLPGFSKKRLELPPGSREN